MSDQIQKDIQELKESLLALQKDVAKETASSKHATIIVTTNNFEKLVMAFSNAACMASLGMEVSMYFEFLGISALKKKNVHVKKSFIDKIIGLMLPNNIEDSKLSQFHMFGLGRWIMRKSMKKHNMPSLTELLTTAQSLNIKLIACTPTLNLFGLKPEELIDGITFCGAAAFLLESSHSKITWVVC